jgi:drug/metabolite transporter (DMT)-like permease
MRLFLGLVLVVAGWLFMVENDQEHITITLPGSGQIGPFSVGVVVLGAVLTGILLCLLGGVLLKVVSRLKKSRSPEGGNSVSEPPHAPH